MVDINFPNVVTVGLISVVAWAALNFVLTKTGTKPGWM